jgi:uncharacterized membrane protein YphA (DoxX/SURF4 family)
MEKSSVEEKIYLILRIAVAMCFIGHGSFGIITKPVWANYFAVFGIGHTLAYQLMPVLGTVDILLGITMLVYPVRAIAGWLVIWGLVTALLRPLSGEPFAEFIERAGNYGAPFTLLLLCGARSFNFKYWFSQIKFSPRTDKLNTENLEICLRIACFLLLAGHGWLNVIAKKSLLTQYGSIGIGDPNHTALIIGLFEIIAAIIILVRPIKGLLLIFLIWKIVSELLYPHYEIFEWIERGGSYGCLLSLWLLLKSNPAQKPTPIVHYKTA